MAGERFPKSSCPKNIPILEMRGIFGGGRGTCSRATLKFKERRRTMNKTKKDILPTATMISSIRRP